MQRDVGVTAITAIELSDEDKVNLQLRLKRIFGLQTQSIKYEVDPSIIAGIIIKTSERIIDDSIVSKLHALRLKLTSYNDEQVKNSEHP